MSLFKNVGIGTEEYYINWLNKNLKYDIIPVRPKNIDGEVMFNFNYVENRELSLSQFPKGIKFYDKSIFLADLNIIFDLNGDTGRIYLELWSALENVRNSIENEKSDLEITRTEFGKRFPEINRLFPKLIIFQNANFTLIITDNNNKKLIL